MLCAACSDTERLCTRWVGGRVGRHVGDRRLIPAVGSLSPTPCVHTHRVSTHTPPNNNRLTSSTRSMTTLVPTTTSTQPGQSCLWSHQSSRRRCAWRACAAAPCPPAHALAVAARAGQVLAAWQQLWQRSCRTSSTGRAQGGEAVQQRRQRVVAVVVAGGGAGVALRRCSVAARRRCSSCMGSWQTLTATMTATAVSRSRVSMCGCQTMTACVAV